MKVKELIAELQKQDQEALVIFSKDSEGNIFKPIDEVEACLYVADQSWYGECKSIFNGDISSQEFNEFIESFYSDNIEEGKEYYFKLLNSTENQAVCLWPIN